ncbi:tetratricopeptide repeat protein [Streptomyces sp. FIT100]|uniref:ATP-binding protein n=1 Tax=Streptomyces sp. FIT100 TaxID=2837956 RepID=UPI0021CA7042|nr:tetratricopeptide repeat protein [Streptomyces sp. FIT100]UUN25806.1 tetratricopeptide repeat protein [Streptomyces sp. FIT100]
MRRSNLPAELGAFVGREDELAELERLLAGSRLVTLAGAGGVGKSRLALRIATGLEKRYCDGVRLAELSTVRDPSLLEHTLAEALGLTDHTSRAPREMLAGHLAERQLLLVLDGFEQIVDACATLVRELLREAPGLRVFAVGRRPLRVAGEALLPLAPLPEDDAVRLFADRATAAAPGFRLADGNREAVRELCRRLDGIPLALELAAGRLPVLSVDEVLHRLDDRFRLLTGGARGELPRHGTLRTAIGWSHELCTAPERLLWARLSVFAGPFDLEAAEYVCGGAGLPAETVLDVLGELLAQSVVYREDTPAGVRYRMLDTVRAYGAEWLGAMGDTERMRRRHRDWYTGLATWCELDWFSPRQAEVAACADTDLPNLRAALELCVESEGEIHLAQYLAGTLWFFWVGCGRLAEGRHWLERAMAADSAAAGSREVTGSREVAGVHEPAAGAPEHHGDVRLKALWVLGYVAILQGDDTAAVGALHECAETAVRTGNRLAAAYSTHRMGCLALLGDDMERAEELLRAALAQYRELGELNSNVLMGQVELGMSLVFQGELTAAVALCQEVREICVERGERWTRAYALYVLAYACWTRGDHREARELLAECIRIDHAFRDLVGLVLAIELLALVTASQGDPAEAAVLQGAAAPVWDTVGLPLFGSGYFSAPRALCEQEAGEVLGTAEYDARLREGRELSLDAAVERALGWHEEHASGVPAPRATRRQPARETREPAGSPTGKGGEAAG